MSATHEPEPVECPDCWGVGAVNEWDGYGHQRTMCARCLGDGAVEPDA